jgi:hypothetical protein
MEYKFTFKKLWKHICTVCVHKKNVAHYCFKFGIWWRGIMHDMHKFSWEELYESVKYYTGTCSPIPIAKKENGMSIAWMHHKNHPLGKHHYEYWQDNFDTGRKSLIMPFVYNLEALCDYLGACKTYGKHTNDMDVYKSELKFWKEIGRPNSVAMNEVNKMFIDVCLEKLAKDGELSRKTAEEYYSVCLYTYEYRQLKFN